MDLKIRKKLNKKYQKSKNSKSNFHCTRRIALKRVTSRIGLNLHLNPLTNSHEFFVNLNFVFSKSMNLNILIEHSTNLDFFDLKQGWANFLHEGLHRKKNLKPIGRAK